MTEAQLRGYLKGRFRNYRDTLTSDDDLNGVVDSLGLFELVTFVEDTSGVRIPTQEFTPARFSSIRSILAFVDQLRAQGNAAPR